MYEVACLGSFEFHFFSDCAVGYLCWKNVYLGLLLFNFKDLFTYLTRGKNTTMALPSFDFFFFLLFMHSEC